jgi:hypothetical protein
VESRSIFPAPEIFLCAPEHPVSQFCYLFMIVLSWFGIQFYFIALKENRSLFLVFLMLPETAGERFLQSDFLLRLRLHISCQASCSDPFSFCCFSLSSTQFGAMLFLPAQSCSTVVCVPERQERGS